MDPKLTFYHGSLIRGIILRDGDEVAEKIIDNAFWRILSNGPFPIPYTAVKEKLLDEDAFYYHQAVCRLLNKGVGAILTPTASSYFPVLASYSNEYNISLVSPELVETPDDPKAPDLMAKFAVGIRPSTTRAILDLIRDLRWQEIVYIYDDENGPEKLQIMFRVGYGALKLKLLGITRVSSARQAIEYLQTLDNPGKHRNFHVILDTDASLARDILQLHVHHTGIRKKNYQFVLSEPTLEKFWTLHEFGLLKITGFLALPPDFDRVNHIKEEWLKLLGNRSPDGEPDLTISDYYYFDAAMFLSQAISMIWNRKMNPPVYAMKPFSSKMKDCFQGQVDGRIAQIIKKTNTRKGLTGNIQYPEIKGTRININLTIVQSTPTGYREFGSWTDTGNFGGIRRYSNSKSYKPGALPQVSDANVLRITTIISPPYMMIKKAENGSEFQGNDRFEGFCKDMIDIICGMLQMKCMINLVEDNSYGKFDSSKERWSGMVGEIIQGKADVAVADLAVTGKRQRVVDFTDPFDMVSFSVVMKNPQSVPAASSMFFVFNAFSLGVWICILASAILFSVLFHAITKFTGAPDSIQSASGIWGRRNAITMNVWFAIGSSMMQGTGVYPRSISSRILTGAWWFSTAVFTCLFIASLTSQLRVNDSTGERSPQYVQLKALSLESILLESLEKGWPKVGVIYPSNAASFIKRSSIPLYKRLSAVLDANPDLKISSKEEGIQKVRDSNGGFILMMESTSGDYYGRQKPCDLVLTHDTYNFAGYAIAFSSVLDSALKTNISTALIKIQREGVLGHLHRKWWIESSQCKKDFVQFETLGTLHSFSGVLCILLAGFLVLLIIFGIQFSRRIQDKESRMHQLTFDDMNLDNRLPTPPPELLSQPPPVLDVPEIEKRTSESESFKDFFDRMRTGP
ncbi:Glutamate receptor 1 like protein [Argiope bruennichi]|uniref:Glutamate receptor 1 like protein n=1 Tax=Argiope bruennichi TaxID=94029 RepID=A0A8T0FLS1_ARGBR|nr:Glutamate receptor 1 like protein [Argiope bruennichi]